MGGRLSIFSYYEGNSIVIDEFYFVLANNKSFKNRIISSFRNF